MVARKLFRAEIQVFSAFVVFSCNCNWFALTAALACDHRTRFDVKKLARHNNKISRWAPLALALAVSSAAYAADAIMRNPEQALDVLQRLRGCGISLSVDDFGTDRKSVV